MNTEIGLLALFAITSTIVAVPIPTVTNAAQHDHELVKRDMEGMGSFMKNLGNGNGGMEEMMKKFGTGSGSGGMGDMMKNFGGGAGGGDMAEMMKKFGGGAAGGGMSEMMKKLGGGAGSGGFGEMLKKMGGGEGGMQDMMKKLQSSGGINEIMKSLGGDGKGGAGPLAGVMGMIKNVLGGKDFGEVLKGMTGGKGGGLDFSKMFAAFGGNGAAGKK